MIRDVPLTGIFVNDQAAALEFYAGKLELELVRDEPYGEGARWITVSPAGSGTRTIPWANEYPLLRIEKDPSEKSYRPKSPLPGPR